MKKRIEDIPFLEIIKNGWNIAWHHRYLWWFGLFVSLVSVGSGLDQIYGPGSKQETDLEMSTRFGHFVSQNINWIIIGAVIFLILFIVFLILGFIGRGALIKSGEKIIKGESSDFHIGMRDGKRYALRLFLLNVILGLFIAFSLIILIVPVIFSFYNQAAATGIILAVLAFIIMIPLFIILVFLKEYGYLYIVLGDLSVWLALENAYILFRKNVLSSIIMGLLFVPLGIALTFLVFLLFLPIALVFIPFVLLFYTLSGTIAAITIAAIGLLVFLVVSLALRSVYEVFAQMIWILFFREIALPKEEDEAKEEVKEPEIKSLPASDAIKTAEVEK